MKMLESPTGTPVGKPVLTVITATAEEIRQAGGKNILFDKSFNALMQLKSKQDYSNANAVLLGEEFSSMNETGVVITTAIQFYNI